MGVAIPVSGVVGFAIRVRTVEKLRLENQKLRLEVDELARRAENAERVIVGATKDEIKIYSETRYSRAAVRDSMGGSFPRKDMLRRPSFGEWALMAGLVVVGCYLLFDLYRLIRWAASFLGFGW